MAIKLFDYQREMRKSVLEAFCPHDSVMCQMPTGTSKTHVLASVVSEYTKGRMVWVVVHRRELIEQIEILLSGKLYGRMYEHLFPRTADAPNELSLSFDIKSH